MIRAWEQPGFKSFFFTGQISSVTCADAAGRWEVKQEGTEYQQQDTPSQNHPRRDVNDNFASPFAASGVQAAEMSRDFLLPSNLPNSRYGESNSHSYPCCQALDEKPC